MRCFLAVACVTVALIRVPASAQTPTDSLRDRIATRIAETPGAVAGVTFLDLGTGARMELNGDTAFHAASTMKVPVMIEAHRSAERGGLRLDQPVLLVNQYGSIVDGSPYSLTPLEDSDSTVYALVGTRVTARQLVERMIVRSSNLATNALIALLGAEHVTATARALGARDIRVLRGVEDGKAFQQGLNNTTSANDLAALMAAIETGRAASPRACREMLATLRRQEFNDEIPAGLPPGTPVAHKTGQITAVLHDAAIVYPPGRSPYVLVVLTRGMKDDRVAQRLIADISRIVWEFDSRETH